MKREYNKLVRDRIPEIITDSGKKCVAEILTEEAYLQKLREKLNEEVDEYQQSSSHEELADILEVVYALAAATGCPEEHLNAIRREKARKRGGFSKKILLKSVE